MARYALLILPSANRVYTESAIPLTVAEVTLFGDSVLAGRLSDVTIEKIGGVSYVTFTADSLSETDIAYLSNVSTMYALFAVEGSFMRPLTISKLDRYDDDLITIQKYPGKTNEMFTKLLLNIALLSSAFAADMIRGPLRVLDPLCGRGTTLNQALMYGYDAAGVDLDQKDFEAYATFMSTWLKRKRLKHHLDRNPVRRNRQVVARRLTVDLAATKEDYKAGRTQHLDVVNTDCVKAGEFFRPATFHLLVMDAPYGVQHGSRATSGRLSRSPIELLTEAAPVWAKLLVPGGAIGIAWNTLVAHRDQASEILASAGLEPLGSAVHLSFRHRVDQAINRDVVVARRPGQ
jgi:SAM-dependent methyltransferase